jgi:hypothetical protein
LGVVDLLRHLEFIFPKGKEVLQSLKLITDGFNLQIDWTSLMQQRIVRSFSLTDPASNLADSAHDALTHASGSLSDLWSKIQSTLPDYYAVGLWGYCSGEESASKYSSCSTPTLLFSFDLVAILDFNTPSATSLLPEASKTVLSGLLKPSRVAIAAYEGLAFPAMEILKISESTQLRSSKSGIKILPASYELVESRDLVVLITNLIMEMISINDNFYFINID